ncbi:MAG: alanine dehydrogenase, partial [Chloroflexota bacterium]|nr:alanine dehydrogenase [Chloroflexota bacterium]
MHKEAGEVRDFLPELIRRLALMVEKVVLEEGYGAGMGFEPEQYTHGCKNVHFESNQVCYHQDIVVQIRAPEDDEL